MKKKELYVVMANRYGDVQQDSYFVSVCGRKYEAIKQADAEYEQRGGKYELYVMETELDKGVGRFIYRKPSK